MLFNLISACFMDASWLMAQRLSTLLQVLQPDNSSLSLSRSLSLCVSHFLSERYLSYMALMHHPLFSVYRYVRYSWDSDK